MNIADEILFSQIALTKIEGIGQRFARRLIQQFGDAKSIFDASARHLSAIERVGEKRARAIKKDIDVASIQRELDFIQKQEIRALFFTDEDYPERLKDCPDAPLMIYFKGNTPLNNIRTVAIVGTRKQTEYGQKMTEALVEGLLPYGVTIVSGLAYGVDIIAHRKAIQKGISTIGVMAHGLDRIYPRAHSFMANEMIQNGGLLTEYTSGTNTDRQNFPMRNRIVAGISDVTVVIETDLQGGAMITAKLAAGYNREVAAFPGKATDLKSQGCNYLIKTNIAHMIQTADELAELMNWRSYNRRIAQVRLFPDLTSEEKKIMEILQSSELMHIDELQLKAGSDSTKLSSLLLGLELQAMVRSLPGKRYMIQ